MKTIPWRAQLGLVAIGYGAALLVAAAMIYLRYRLYADHAAEAAAAGGMYAGGDMLLAVILGCMFLVPTFFLVLVIRKSEPAHTLLAKILFGLSLTAPVAAGLLFLPAVSQSSGWLGWACGYRMFSSPFLIVAYGISRFFARFARARRLSSYAALIEVLTLVLSVVLLFLLAKLRG